MSAPRTNSSADAATSGKPSAGHWDYDDGDLSIYTMDDGGSPVFLFQPHDLCDGDVIPWAEMVANACVVARATDLLVAAVALQTARNRHALNATMANADAVAVASQQLSAAIDLATGAA